jgi:lipid-A-disaccharide synthase
MPTVGPRTIDLVAGAGITGLALEAGGGRLPLMIAESVVRKGGGVHIVGIEGEADPAIANFAHTWVKWGQLGRMVETLRQAGPDLVIAGSVKRPNLRKLRPDLGFFRSLPKVLGLLAGGDDSVLTRAVRFFEANGLVVRGAHDVAPELLAQEGAIASAPLSLSAQADAEVGFAVRAVLGPLDAGQAVVVADGRVLAIEGAEGTDAMIERAGRLRAELGLPAGGVLAKGPKPGQELRVDMPTVGPRTIDLVAGAGITGLALEAGGVLIVDRDDLVRAADARHIAVAGLTRGSHPVQNRAAAELGAFAGRVIGRLQPGQRDRRDMVQGLAAVECLAAYATGHAAVVMSAYIVAIAAAEPVTSMIERVRALRQWGIGERRRRGVLVCRADALFGSAMPKVFSLTAAHGLAGLVVVGTPDDVALLETEGPALADGESLFLVTCRRPPA